MQIYAKCTNPTAGYPHDSEQAKLLDSEKYYEVKSIDIGGWHTSVELNDVPNKTYNSVNFQFYVYIGGAYVWHDIFSDGGE